MPGYGPQNHASYEARALDEVQDAGAEVATEWCSGRLESWHLPTHLFIVQVRAWHRSEALLEATRVGAS